MITSGLKAPNDAHKIKNEEYYLAMGQYCLILFDTLSDKFGKDIACNISTYLSILDNDIFIHYNEYFGCDKAYMWAYRSFIFTNHMYRISNKTKVVELLRHPKMRITQRMQIIDKLREIKKNNDESTFYINFPSFTFYNDSDSDDDNDEIDIYKIMNDILDIYLQQLKLLFLNEQLLQKNYFNFIRFIINHLCNNLSQKNKKIVLSYYDKKISSLSVSNSDELIKKMILKYFV